MSRISENIRKIIRAWGGKPTGNGISDALSDLYNNLPFGTKVETVEILAEQTLTEIVDDAFNFKPVNCAYENGQKIIVNYNGVKYICNAFVENGGMAVGNVGAISAEFENTGEPFLIQIGTDFAFCAPLDGSTSVTLSISTEQETVTPIPQKYLPQVIFTKENGEYSCNKTFNECVKLIDNGSIIANFHDEQSVKPIVIINKYSEMIEFYYQSQSGLLSFLYANDNTVRVD